MATSDVIDLNGMSDFSQVPNGALVHAGHRGSATHLAILAHETGCDVKDAIRGYEVLHDVSLMDEVIERMSAYQSFKKVYSVKLAGLMEKSRVYRHLGTEALIGATPDMPCYIDGVLTILDPKTCHKQYGEKLKQLKLKWRAQTQSYVEALEADDNFWKHHKRPDRIARAVLHLHPECGKERNCKPLGWEFHPFTGGEDDHLWDSMIRVAQAKLGNGYKLDSRLPKSDALVVTKKAPYEVADDVIF